MRVRVNFTIELDPEDYREAMQEDVSKEGIRACLQERARSDLLMHLIHEGVPVRLLGSNNVYDARTRTTRSEQLAGKP